MLLRLEELEKAIGDRVLFRGVSLVLRAGDRIGVVGPNGAGKSTLLRLILGEEPQDGGAVQRPRTTRIGMLRQEIDPRASRSVRDEARTAFAELDALEAEIAALEGEMSRRGHDGEAISSGLGERYDALASRYRLAGGFERDARVATVLAGLGFDDARADRPLSSFSGGWLMRVELAKLLLARPDVLLLDEPTNHLDLPSIRFFEETLARFPGAVVVVSHDRTFLRRQANRIVELDGHGGFALYEGNYDTYLRERVGRREELLARKANQDRQIAEMERFVERFRAQATKARQAQSRLKALGKIERIEVEPDRRKSIRLRLAEPARSGERVLSLSGIHKRYGDEVIYAGVDLEILRGERVALAGPNGAGKSTLLRIAAGALPFDAGSRTLGHNVELAYFAQHQLEALDPAASILEDVERSARFEDVPRIRGLLGALLFSGDDVDKKIAVLSGGEKARVALAKLLLRPANLLILDEPTNHLDIEACEVLEEAFQHFGGTILFVSHDRSFINALATRVVDVDHGRLESHLGNYDAYLERIERAEKRLGQPGEDGSPRVGVARAGSPGAAAAAGADGLPAEGERSDKQDRQLERERKKARERDARKLEKLEARIAEQEGRIEALKQSFALPEVYQDFERLRVLQGEQSGLEAELEALYREWESLSETLSTP
ncbi:MAG: ABC-F family ATP-binding cassette domain-containing protein [Deltaproteobacteria bacterium]|nr:ABC-F family ATP-binding cassette domain-containing protein [Deltaproteobacteria bacterium]